MGRPKLLKKVLIGAGLFIAIIIFLVFLTIYFLPELTILYIRYYSVPESANPEPYMVPASRVLEDTEQLNGESVSYKGLIFQTPWGAPIDSKEADEGESCRFWFAGDREMFVIPDAPIAYDYYIAIEEGNQELKYLLGDEPTVYGLLEPLMNITPNNIQFFQSREKMHTELARLMLKIEMLPRCNKIYHLKTPYVDVIEYYIGHVNGNEKYLLEISDESGNFYSIIVFGPVIVQSEIEQLVASMRIEKP